MVILFIVGLESETILKEENESQVLKVYFHDTV